MTLHFSVTFHNPLRRGFRVYVLWQAGDSVMVGVAWVGQRQDTCQQAPVPPEYQVFHHKRPWFNQMPKLRKNIWKQASINYGINNAIL